MSCGICAILGNHVPPPGPDRFVWELRTITAHYHSDPAVRAEALAAAQKGR
jgi:hypothetical protein